jgi:hypothetical protein
MKQVGAPLSGLIRSERHKAFTRIAGAVVMFAIVLVRFSV